MLAMHPGVRVFVARGPTDMRKGFDGLTGLVCELVKEDPQSGHLFGTCPVTPSPASRALSAVAS